MDLTGKTAFITGAARGIGRSCAIRLAGAGADIIAVDICDQIDTVPYGLSTPEDLAITVKEVEALGQRIHAARADVRDRDQLREAFEAGVEELGGGVDIVLANAGVMPLALEQDHDVRPWEDVLAVNVTGVFNTIEVAVGRMITQGRGGSIVITSSTGGVKGYVTRNPGGLGYMASKHAVVGLMRSYAMTLAPDNIRVNTIHPTGVNTTLATNDAVAAWIQENPNSLMNALPVMLLEPSDVSNAVAWLVSDEARYVTGTTHLVDAGFTL